MRSIQNKPGFTAVVTGANQGLGRALVEGLLRESGPESNVYLTGRNRERILAVAEELKSIGLRPLTEVMDVRRDDQVESLAHLIRERHGHVDVVISNAAALQNPLLSPAEQVEEIIDTNNLGATRMIRAFAPLLVQGSRFLVVSSDFGSLRNLPVELHTRFNTDRMSLSDLDNEMTDYMAAVISDRATTQGWPGWVNIPSKIGQVAAIRIFAREQRSRAELDGRFIAAVCPGLIDNERSRPFFQDMSAAQTPTEAAVDVLFVAVGAVDTRWYGELVQHRQSIPWM